MPAFEAMISKWQEMQVELPELADVIQKGLDKLGSYQERLERVPAYVLAMSKSIIIRSHRSSFLLFELELEVLNPAIKLRWFSQYRPDKIEWAKRIFKNAVRALLTTTYLNSLQCIASGIRR